MSTIEIAEIAGQHELDRASIESSGIANVTPSQFSAITGLVADFSRADGNKNPGYDRPVSVVYGQNLSGKLERIMDLESYQGPYQPRGPLGGSAVHPNTPVRFIVTR